MNKITAIYPGTFDPVTNGHLDVIHRACGLFSKVIVTIAVNPLKQPLFSTSERLQLIKEAAGSLNNLEVDSFNGMLVDYAKMKNAGVIIRGLRAVSDFEYEFQMSLTNRKYAPDVNTIFLMPHEKYTYLNSSLIRELASFGADVSDFVPDNVSDALKEKYANKKSR